MKWLLLSPASKRGAALHLLFWKEFLPLTLKVDFPGHQDGMWELTEREL